MIAPLWLYAAALLSGLILIVHLTLGQRDIVRPLLASALESEPKWANFFCWHAVTIAILGMILGSLAPLLRADLWPLALGVCAISGAMGIWSLALSLTAGRSPMLLPQWIIFLPIALAAYVGVKDLI